MDISGDSARTGTLLIKHSYVIGILALAIVLSACGTVPNEPSRAAYSTLGCMRAGVVISRSTEADNDEQAHCLAAGMIARYCSIFEAYLAGVGKEISDLFTRGDAQWSDWRADRDGIGCARVAQDDADLVLCCMRGKQPYTAAPSRQPR